MYAKKMGILTLATGLCLSTWLAGCGKTEGKDTGNQDSEMTEISAESTSETNITEAETTEADTSTAADDYVEIWLDGELVVKVPTKPIEGWTLDYEPDYYEEDGYSFYSYHDEKDNWYGYHFYPDSDTWKLIMFWPYDNLGTGYYLNEEDGTWFESDGRDG